MNDLSHVEVIWGFRLLDEGFTSIPNLLIRNYRKMKIEHGEFGFLCSLISYKHDARDPYPSREALAKNLQCSTRQIDKWVKSLREKKLLRTGRRRNANSKQWDNAVYSLKPLIDSLLKLMGDQPLPPQQEEFEILWDDEPCEPQVRMESEPQVRMESEPQVRTKITNKNKKKKDDDDIKKSQTTKFEKSSIKNEKESEFLRALNKNNISTEEGNKILKGLEYNQKTIEQYAPITIHSTIEKAKKGQLSGSISSLTAWFVATLDNEQLAYEHLLGRSYEEDWDDSKLRTVLYSRFNRFVS